LAALALTIVSNASVNNRAGNKKTVETEKRRWQDMVVLEDPASRRAPSARLGGTRVSVSISKAVGARSDIICGIRLVI
jgi:hypothetical protein